MVREDLTGRIYGGLKVIKAAPSHITPSGHVNAMWICRCLKCGSEKVYPASNIKRGIKDCGCSRNQPIEIGKQYGFISVLSVADSEYPVKYNCRCEKCGALLVSRAQNIYKNQGGGCAECRKAERDQEKISRIRADYQGKEYGELTIDDVALEDIKNIKTPVAFCTCRCGKKTTIPLRRILTGGALTCGHNTDRNFETGHTIVDKASVQDTNVLSIRPGRKTNKNSATGIKGVSQMHDGRYRAYINFQRKQYHLGVFDKIDDAADVRKEAEAKIYGDFLKWYAETYPDRWELINRKSR